MEPTDPTVMTANFFLRIANSDANLNSGNLIQPARPHCPGRSTQVPESRKQQTIFSLSWHTTVTFQQDIRFTMNQINRRKFISASLTGLAGTSLLIPTLLHGEVPTAKKKQIGFQSWVMRNELGNDFSGTLKRWGHWASTALKCAHLRAMRRWALARFRVSVHGN